MKKILVYHHNDLDGIASAAIINFYEGGPRSQDGLLQNLVHFVGYDYVDDSVISIEEAATYDLVYVVDMVLQPFPKMMELVKAAKVIWIDHHVGAISEYEKLSDVEKKLFHDVYLGGYHNMKSACELVFEYFNKKKPIHLPRGIRNISRVDTWHHNDDEVTWAFFEYCDYLMFDPEHPDWKYVLYDDDDFFEEAVSLGLTLRKYRRYREDKHAKENSLEVMFDGYPCIALNSDSLGSSQFDAQYNPAKHKMMIRFSRARGAWKFSIYTTHDDLDLSVIAKKYGGGGHRKASGFTIRTDEIPFKLG